MTEGGGASFEKRKKLGPVKTPTPKLHQLREIRGRAEGKADHEHMLVAKKKSLGRC